MSIRIIHLVVKCRYPVRQQNNVLKVSLRTVQQVGGFPYTALSKRTPISIKTIDCI